MGGGRSLTSVIEPSHSRGYICWNSIPNVKYEVKLLQKDSLGNYYQVGQKTTTNNYARLLKENYTDTKGLYYSIVAYDANNGSIVQESDAQTYIIGGGNGYTELCTNTCNGSSYSWMLKISESDYGNTRMSVHNGYQSINQELDIVIPFYQAFNTTSLSSYSPLHPYSIITDNGPTGAPIYLYKRIPINSNTPGGPFFDKNNNLVANGFLLEKKADQFELMISSLASGNPGNEMCLVNNITQGGAWMNWYNTYVDLNTLSQPSYEYSYFTINEPAGLECDNSSSSSNINNDNQIIENLAGCPFDSVPISSYFNCVLCDDPNYDPDPMLDVLPCPDIIGFMVYQINQASDTIIIHSENEAIDISCLNNLTTGLYQFLIYKSNGSIIPLTFEQKINRNNLKNYVNLTLRPTIITNNELKINISSKKI